MTSLLNEIPPEVTEAVGESLKLLQNTRFGQTARNPEHSLPLPSLLERCEELIERQEKTTQEPVRLIHHFACTGGTLIVKCLACSPNVQVLSEVDPLSTMLAQKSKFNPTDLIQLLEHSNRGASIEEKLALFRAAFAVLYDSAERKGLRMLVRDHTHSHFCTDAEINRRPTTGEILAEQYETRAVITVRHPLDSWLSLVKNDWISFQPGTLDEYANRYWEFLKAYPNTRVLKYEDFADNPDVVLSEMCDELDISFPPEFRAIFMAHGFSGDSGRKSDVIGPRERRPVADDLMEQAYCSQAFQSLCQKLQYRI